ncbi:MAG TPA: glycoside hydrolase family 11 protein [Polyangiaceae bacterium]
MIARAKAHPSRVTGQWLASQTMRNTHVRTIPLPLLALAALFAIDCVGGGQIEGATSRDTTSPPDGSGGAGYLNCNCSRSLDGSFVCDCGSTTVSYRPGTVSHSVSTGGSGSPVTNGQGGSASSQGGSSPATGGVASPAVGGTRGTAANNDGTSNLGGVSSGSANTSSTNMGGSNAGGSSARSTMCTDTPRSSESCENAKAWGFCGQGWFAGNCDATCGSCSMGTGGGPGNNRGGAAAAGGSRPVNVGGSVARTSVTGGAPGTGTGPATGGTVATTATANTSTGGASIAATATVPAIPSSSTLDCSAIPAMPTGGVTHTSGTGGADNLAWEIWSNAGSGTLTTFSTPAFRAAWNNSGDFLGRLGFEWGNSGRAYSAYGTITAEFAVKKTGTGGPYSYIGIYGWSTNPCVEWYIVDDSFSAMPFNPGTAPSGTVNIDGGTYNLIKSNTTGTGGSRCGNATNWDQFYSIRTTGRQCGVISVTDHFKAWDAKGWKLGNLLEVKILVEAGGGNGSAEFPVANVKKTQ